MVCEIISFIIYQDQLKIGKNLNIDIFFCFGENEKKRLNKIIKAKIYPLGILK